MANKDDTTTHDYPGSALSDLEHPIYAVACISRILILMGAPDIWEDDDRLAVGWLGDRLAEIAKEMKMHFYGPDATNGLVL